MVNCDLALLVVVTSPAGVLHILGLLQEDLTLSFPVSFLVMTLSVPPLSSSAVYRNRLGFASLCTESQEHNGFQMSRLLTLLSWFRLASDE